MPILTIFTTPKPFTNPHITTIQRNALANWQALGSDVSVIVLENEEGAAAAASQYGALHLPQMARNKEGTPLISDLFEQARLHAASPLLAYVNADILLMPDFVETARKVMETEKHFLLVGQRWDLDITELLDFSVGWDITLRKRAQQNGKLHPPAGSDYFIFPKDDYRVIPYLDEKPGRFHKHVVNAEEDYGHLRWTVDTQEDLQAVRGLYALLGGRRDCTWQEILEIWKSHPELEMMNRAVNHKKFDDVDKYYRG